MLERIARAFTRMPDPVSPPDPLRDQIERATDAQRDAIAVINESRRRRGEPPLDPSWEQLLGVPADECVRNGAGRHR